MSAPKKILIIDDEYDFCEMMQDHLNLAGYHAFYSIDAQKGLELAKVERPDVVLLDILMPGISGLECLKLLKQEDPNVIVVIVSGMQDEAIAKTAIEQGAYDYLTKPFEMDYLESSILARLF